MRKSTRYKTHIYYQVEGYDKWEITEDTFRKLDWDSQHEILTALRVLHAKLLDVYIEQEADE